MNSTALNPCEPPHSVPQVPDFLRPLQSLLMAVIDSDGLLLDANRGFLNLLGDDTSLESLKSAQIRAQFINPSFEEILQFPPQGMATPAYNGLITLADAENDSQSWQSTLFRQGDLILLVAEHDLKAHRRLQQQLMHLNTDYVNKARELAQALRDMERLSETDKLTGIHNRLFLDNALDHEITRGQRYGTPLSLLLLDLDHFKSVNDRFGHDAGDQVLQAVVEVIQHSLRDTDMLGRWGGEEFAIIAPETNRQNVLALAERVRAAIEQAPMPSPVSGVTSSIGAAEWRTGESARELLRRADKALYRAKHAGRNRCAAAKSLRRPSAVTPQT